MATATATFIERIDQAIHASPHLAGRKVRVRAEGNCVVLQGEVGSFFQKQMAQEALRQVDGVELIENQLEVSSTYC